jgi:hypothetical protein
LVIQFFPSSQRTRQRYFNTADDAVAHPFDHY